MTILVLGATGKTGRRVVRRLRERGVEVRAASRSGEYRFDWDDPGTWAGAVDGVRAVYLVAPVDPGVVDGFVTQAVAAGVERFVVLSGRGLSKVEGRFGAGMSAAERSVRSSGAGWTILAGNNFMQNFDEDLWYEPLLAGRLALPIDQVPDAFVDLEDLAEVAAVVLTSHGHDGKTYELSGPAGVTFPDAVRQISAASGRPIRFEALTPAEYRAELLAAGLPGEFADELDVLFELMRTGEFSTPTGDVERILGRPASSFEAYVDRVWRS